MCFHVCVCVCVCVCMCVCVCESVSMCVCVGMRVRAWLEVVHVQYVDRVTDNKAEQHSLNCIPQKGELQTDYA